MSFETWRPWKPQASWLRGTLGAHLSSVWLERVLKPLASGDQEGSVAGKAAVSTTRMAG